MEVSRSGYYRYEKTDDQGQFPRDFHLISKVRQIHKETKGSYGSRRISQKLKQDGYSVGRYRAKNLMRKAGVEYKSKKRFKRTTDSRHCLPIAKNLLNRQFNPNKPNKVWCSDITYLWTSQGWLYLVVILDLYSRRMIGWSLNKTMKTFLVSDAYTMACFRRKPGKGVIHHSDRGSQYASKKYQKLLKQHGMICSMNRKGDCWDNAVVESFFGTLKSERTDKRMYRTREEARRDVIDYIEIFYNPNRLHSSNGYMSPNDYEDEFNSKDVA